MNRAPDKQRRPASKAMAPPQLPSMLHAAAAQARDRRQPVEQPSLSSPLVSMSDPGDLVARAIAILSEETAAWHERRKTNFSARSTR
jgi:hypothetical protein